ncbi:PadR family transcriptional regulator [Glaciihabitans sp. dw_435]|uniref:PadR family transcriptional regulator n=1 Tax=Glaciihabitans sp. dw_435 TaxID=2720081 RepID=UPI001BD54402
MTHDNAPHDDHTPDDDYTDGPDFGGRGHGHGRGFGGGGPARGGFGRGFGPGFGGIGPRGFVPPGPQRKRKGDVRAAILSLIAEKPFNGYALIKEIAERSGNTWRPSPGSVYPTLQQLVDEGLIEQIGEGRRTEFQLTDEGRAYVTTHAEELERVWQNAAGHSEADADLHESVAKLMGVIHQFRFAATDDQRVLAVKQLDDARRALYAILAD